MTDTTTLAEIAQLAGVSVSTVSRVLNQKPGISDATRLEIEGLLERNGYRRRARATTSATLIDFIISGIDTQWAAQMLRGAESEAARLGADLVVSTTHGKPVGTSDWIEHVMARGTSGVVLVVSELLPAGREALDRLHVPVVMVDPIGGDDVSYPSVTTTNWDGGRDATEHLLSLGHRRIGFITGPIEQTAQRDRLDGYFAALSRAGISPDYDLVRNGNSLVEGGKLHGTSLLDMASPPTAVVSSSDEQAYGVMLAAQARGLVLPRDLSVVGFDDVDLCNWVTPRLTTVRQPLSAMARMATRMVGELSRGETIANARLKVPSELVLRQSTAPPRSE